MHKHTDTHAHRRDRLPNRSSDMSRRSGSFGGKTRRRVLRTFAKRFRFPQPRPDYPQVNATLICGGYAPVVPRLCAAVICGVYTGYTAVTAASFRRRLGSANPGRPGSTWLPARRPRSYAAVIRGGYTRRLRYRCLLAVLPARRCCRSGSRVAAVGPGGAAPRCPPEIGPAERLGAAACRIPMKGRPSTIPTLCFTIMTTLHVPRAVCLGPGRRGSHSPRRG